MGHSSRSGGSGMAMLVLLLSSGASLLLLRPAQGAIPCDGYWLVEGSDAGDYSNLPVAKLGLQTNRSVCTNADDSLAGKAVSLDRYFSATRAEVEQAMREHLLPRVRGGASTTQLIIQDLESPKGIHPRLYGELNATQLAKVVQATKLRFSQTYVSILTVISHINDVPCCWSQDPGRP